MRSLLISGVALGAITLFSPAAMAADSPVATIIGAAQAGAQAMGRTTITNRWGGRIGGRWIGGVQAPGGWAAYRRPTVGTVLPRYWIDSGFTIGNYRVYGLPAPQTGYVWARYYDDAVLVDRNGRVYDSRTGIDWDRDEGGYSDDRYADAGPRLAPPRPPYPDGGYADAAPSRPVPYPDGGYPGGPPQPTLRDNSGTVAGAVLGGVTGGVLGNVVAGRGNRTTGTIVGAGLGAVAGAAIGSASDRANDRARAVPPPPPAIVYRAPLPPVRDLRDDGPRDDDYRDAPRRREDEARRPGPMRGPGWMNDDGPRGEMAMPMPPYGAPRGPMPPQGPMHMPMPGPAYGPGPGQPHITTYTTPGYAAGGYWYPGTTVTTITFQPQVTTITTTKTVTYVTKRVVRKKPAAKPACKC